MATAVELFGKTIRQLHEENLRFQSPKSARELAEKDAEYLRICCFEPIIDEENRVAPTRWSYSDEPLRFPSPSPAPCIETAELLEKNLAQMHRYQNRSPFARFKEAEKDIEKRKPRRKLGKEAVIKRFQKQKNLF